MEKKMFIYTVRDVVADNYLCMFVSTNDGMAIRENARGLSQVAPLGDLELFRIGDFDNATGQIELTDKVLVPWDSYKVPTNPIQKTEAK